jgi:hypothetical protein
VLSGLLWSIVSIWFSARTATVFVEFPIAAVMTGVSISFILYKPLLRSTRLRALCLAALSLPLAVFIFGAFVSLVHSIGQTFGGESPALADFCVGPLYLGLFFAYDAIVVCISSWIGPALLLLTVLTTFLLGLLLRRTIEWSEPPAVSVSTQPDL